MIRVLAYLILVAALAFGAVWLADRPGDVVITWQGSRIDTSVMVLFVAVAAIAVLTTVLWSIIRFIVRSPRLLKRRREHRRGVRGYHAVSQGLIAVGAGDVGAAKRFVDEARRVAPHEPLTLLLSAQTAQLAGDRGAAARSFEQMAGREATRLLGLHGLFIEARRRNDHGAALLHAEEAAKHASVPAWAGQAVLEFRCIAGDWSGAIERLERNYTSGLIDKPAYRRQRAVLLTAQALAAEESDRDRAKASALEAVKLAPTLVPAAALAGRMLGEAGELRKAARIIEAAWIWSSHPDLAEAYAHLRPGDSARERFTRIEALAGKTPGQVEAALAVARAALDAQELASARAALAPLIGAPTRRVGALMAELEMREGDEGRAREWMARALKARRDPAWTADGFVSERWLPVSPVTGRLDAFEWRDPLAGEDHALEDHSGAMIEAGARNALEVPPPSRSALAPPPPEPTHAADTADVVTAATQASPREAGPAPRQEAQQDLRAEPPEPVPLMPPPVSKLDGKGDEPIEPGAQLSQEAPAAQDGRPRQARALKPAPPVIPLVHAPDDPGPETENEPGSTPNVEPPAASWSKLRHLFRS
jgi:HemY protein